MVASITETKLIVRAENAQALMIYIDKVYLNGLYSVVDIEICRDILNTYPFVKELGPKQESIPKVLTSVNDYVRDSLMGNYLDYVRKFTLPEELVDDLTRKITRVNASM